MGIKERISEDMKAAMKQREQLKLDTLRMVASAVKYKEIEKKGDLDDEAMISLLSTQVKQRKEAAELYKKGGRNELAEKEEAEIEILKQYLPEEISGDELTGIIEGIIKEMGASSLADMGKVMKAVMSKVAGRADGSLVSNCVRSKLSG